MAYVQEHPRPHVSVIIPVFNKLELTRTCLASLHEHGQEASFEILVVDNGWTAAGASAEILAAMAERPAGSRPEVMKRMGYAFTTCPTTPSLEEHFYANPATIAAAAYKMVRPGGPSWTPDPERAKLAYQMQFKGPF